VGLGTVGGDRLVLLSGTRVFVDLPVARLHEGWMDLERRLEVPLVPGS
jgi:hypothetical protein